MQSPVKIWRNQKKVQQYVGKSGKLVTWTVIRVPPEGYANQAPYAVGIVELKSGKRITCPLIIDDVTRIQFGQSVELTVRRMKEPEADGVIVYGIKGVIIYG